MRDKKEFVKKVWAFTLGDGMLKKPLIEYKQKNSCYCLTQRDDHKDYVDWQASILQDLTGVHIYHCDPYIDKRGFNVNGQYRLSTNRHPLYTTMRERIYIGGKKSIDPHYLNLLDWQSLAIFYMDDGTTEVRKIKSGISIRSKICSLGYTYGDNYLLRKAIIEKVNIPFDIHRCKNKSGDAWYYFLRASKDNAKRFIEGISPFILPSFEYKINLLDG